VRFARIGTLGDSDIQEVRLYRDADGSGAVSAPDIVIGTGSYNSGSATLLFSSRRRSPSRPRPTW